MSKIENNLHNGHRKRLRQKFLSGKESFKEHELLELLLSYAIPRKDTNNLAHLLIKKCGSLKNVLNANPKLLMSVEGIGENAACFLSLIGYINNLSSKETSNAVSYNSIDEIKEEVVKLFAGYDTEVFYALYLNSKNHITGTLKLQNNVKNSVIIDFKELSQGILLHKPKSIIVAHNHFAEHPLPSEEDDLATQMIYTLLKFYKVNFYDHFIVSGNEIYSYFYDNRLQDIKDRVDANFK